jgi:hypothetical protein
MRFILLFIFALVGCAAMAADREIGFFLPQPGRLDMVFLIQKGKKTVAEVHKLGAEPSERNRPVTKEEFESIWTTFTSAEVSQFEFTPTPSDSISDPKFCTIKIEGARMAKFLRIPVSATLPKPVADSVAQVRAWINEKG